MPVSLAYTIDGDSFVPPEEAVGWRIRRLRTGKGAPELVYGTDGTPLIVPLECTTEELRNEVVSPGRYRLDAVDDQDRLIRRAEPAYVWIHPADPAVTPPLGITAVDTNAVVIEALRQNTELARTVIERFPAMLDSSAALLRAADGAGLPRRVAVDVEAHDDDRDDGDRVPVGGLDLSALLAQLVPVLLSSLSSSGKGKLPSIAEMLDWRKAARGAESEEPPSARREIPAAPAEVNDATPTLSPKALAHFAAVQSALTPDEAALARAAAAELTPAELRSWMSVLVALDVADAVAHVRGELSKIAKSEQAK